MKKNCFCSACGFVRCVVGMVMILFSTVSCSGADTRERDPDFQQFCRSALLAQHAAAVHGDLTKCAPIKVRDTNKLRPLAEIVLHREPHVAELVVDGQSGCLLEMHTGLLPETDKGGSTDKTASAARKLVQLLRLEKNAGIDEYEVVFGYQQPQWGSRSNRVVFPRIADGWPFDTEFMSLVISSFGDQTRLHKVFLNISFDSPPAEISVKLTPKEAE